MPKGRSYSNLVGPALSWLASTVTIAACLSIIAFLAIKGFAVLDWEFVISAPTPSLKQESTGGISTPIVGTVLLTLIGTAIAVPWALATAIYLAEYAGKGSVIRAFRLGIDVLSGIPTIVIGIFGLAVFCLPQFAFLSSSVEGITGANRAYGRSFLVAGITMAIMILPFVIRTCQEALRAVPSEYRESALALGASRWQSIYTVVLPAARNGIVSGIILGMGRIIGDTAIVWLTLGGTLRMTGIQPWWQPENWLSTLKNTGCTLTSYIYFTSPAGEGNMPENAFGAALVLVLIIIILNLIIDLLGRINPRIKEN